MYRDTDETIRADGEYDQCKTELGAFIFVCMFPRVWSVALETYFYYQQVHIITIAFFSPSISSSLFFVLFL